MTKSYTRIQSDMKLIEIVEYLLTQLDPQSGADIARALGMPHATVMSHLASLIDAKWVVPAGGNYEPGPRLMGMYSAYKLGLQGKRDKIQSELDALEA
ncbi:MAG TPA: helix-turn-helix domain-containing protein [Syntrophales bacterium]|nr:helix-turn-helix domain-containing protein [Syntrophales bacterium]